jgi:hypothetical protein
VGNLGDEETVIILQRSIDLSIPQATVGTFHFCCPGCVSGYCLLDVRGRAFPNYLSHHNYMPRYQGITTTAKGHRYLQLVLRCKGYFENAAIKLIDKEREEREVRKAKFHQSTNILIHIPIGTLSKG